LFFVLWGASVPVSDYVIFRVFAVVPPESVQDVFEWVDHDCVISCYCDWVLGYRYLINAIAWGFCAKRCFLIE
jgi:hypothetical protein